MHYNTNLGKVNTFPLPPAQKLPVPFPESLDKSVAFLDNRNVFGKRSEYYASSIFAPRIEQLCKEKFGYAYCYGGRHCYLFFCAAG